LPTNHAAVGAGDYLDAGPAPGCDRSERDASPKAAAHEGLSAEVWRGGPELGKLREVGRNSADDRSELALAPVARLVLGPDAAVACGDPEVPGSHWPTRVAMGARDACESLSELPAQRQVAAWASLRPRVYSPEELRLSTGSRPLRTSSRINARASPDVPPDTPRVVSKPLVIARPGMHNRLGYSTDERP
jgi:hypothetical protein